MLCLRSYSYFLNELVVVPNTSNTKTTDETTEQLLVLVSKLANELRPGARYTKAISLESSLDNDLGFDSLTRVELIHRIEQYFNVSLADDAFASIEKVGDIQTLLQSKHYERPPFDRSVLKTLSISDVEQGPDQARTLIDAVSYTHLRAHETV